MERLFHWLEKSNPSFRENFSVILTGGEPFLLPTQVFEIAKFYRMNEVSCYVNSNGILYKPIVEMVLNSGLTVLTISLDSHIDVFHDNLRDCRGIFQKVIETIKLMLNQKQQDKLPLKIFFQNILGKWNIKSLPAHIGFSKDLGVDDNKQSTILRLLNSECVSYEDSTMALKQLDITFEKLEKLRSLDDIHNYLKSHIDEIIEKKIGDELPSGLCILILIITSLIAILIVIALLICILSFGFLCDINLMLENVCG